MQASTHFLAVLLLTACAAPPTPTAAPPTAVRVVEARQGPVVEGRTTLGEVVAQRAVRVVAQVPGAVAALPAPVGATVRAGEPLAQVAAPDVAARVVRARAERARAEAERDFACAQAATDRVLAEAGDLPAVRVDTSDKTCAALTLAAEAAAAGEREAGVAGSRAVERAPFDGVVLAHLVDPGQTVGPGAPLVQFGSVAREIAVRVPEAEAVAVAVGSAARTELGPAHVVEIGALAAGPGRLVELRLALDDEALSPRVGQAVSVTLVREARDEATAVPDTALGRDADGAFVFAVDQERLRRVPVVPGPREQGWVAVDPPLPPGTRVVESGVSALRADTLVLAVSR